MKRILIGMCMAGALFTQGCSSGMNDFMDNHEAVHPEAEDSTSNYESGVIRVKLSEALCESISENEDTRTLKTRLSNELGNLPIVSMKRLYPYAGKFEKRTREMGMHQWYVVKFDPNMPTSRMVSSFTRSKDVEKVERVPVIIHFKSEVTTNYTSMVQAKAASQATSEAPFNDPYLSDQWHYKNNADNKNHLPNADVNVYPVWKNKLVGNAEVIVCVVDNGVDYMHEDLIDNIYMNRAEQGGTPGEDSDNNGYIDDVYGYNFVDNTGTIEPNDHATHVAGVVAAMNNNGKGVCGLAGGDGTPNSGVKILIAQIFTKKGSTDGAPAIKYGADNGAVISQNSWGYPSLTEAPESDRLAIDYFNKYAGVDENDQQVGPIRGGIVVFATGNENRPYSSPGSYRGAVSVTSIAPDYTKAYYSNYGLYASIAAPGGSLETKYGLGEAGGILSTIANNSYGRMQGTSMACPHVSGAFALLVSQVANAGTKEVTGKELIDKMLVNTRPIDNYNPLYEDQMGRGLVDIYRAIGGSSQQAPDAVSDFSLISKTHSTATFEWTVPNDADDANDIGFTIYYSTETLDGVDFNNLPSHVGSAVVGEYTPATGSKMSTRIRGLQPGTSYHFAVQAYDLSGNKAALSNLVQTTLTENAAPIITARDGSEIYVKENTTGRLRFDIKDPENEELKVNFNTASSAESFIVSNNVVTLFLNTSGIKVGTYTTQLVVTDLYGASSEKAITYHIIKETSPEITDKELANVEMTAIHEEYRFNWTEYIVDKDGDQLQTSVKVENEAIATATIIGDEVVITTKAFGSTRVILSAKDSNNPAVERSFILICKGEGVPNALELQMYPNPVREKLNISSNETVTGTLHVFNANGAKVKSENNLELKNGSAATIDMKSLRPGQYSVQFEANGVTIKRNITKI